MIHALSLIYTTAQKGPPVKANARGNEATGSSATSIVLAYSTKGNLSFPEDELSLDRTPLDEVIEMEPTNKVLIASTCPGNIKHSTNRL